MSSRPTVQDIQTYLLDAGWERRPQTWNDASIWLNSGGYEVLVPGNDDLADTSLRVAEILSTLALVERRPAAEIGDDINTPFDDMQLYRTFSDSGAISLTSGLLALQSVRELISAAARTVVDGPLPVIPRGTPGAVGELLAQIQLGPSRLADHAFTVRVPLSPASGSTGDGQPRNTSVATPLGRQVGHRIRAAVIAARSAAEHATEEDLSAFDETVAAGVSANLCDALSGIAGRQHAQPFEIAFRWGRGLPSDVPADAVRFPGGAGTTFRAGAARLRQLGGAARISGAASMSGLVESLHGQSSNGGWRIDISGDLLTGAAIESGRTVRVWLDSEATYDQAITAHRSRQHVRVRGELSGGGHAELVVNGDNFEILEGNL